MKKTFLKLLTIMCTLGLVLLLPLLVQAKTVAVVKSHSLSSYNHVLTGFSVDSKASIVEYDMKNDLSRGKKIFKILNTKEKKPDLVIAIGPSAANMAKREISDIPIIFCMVPNLEKYDLSADNITGITLQLPVKTQLATLKTLAPKIRNVGVVYNPKYTQKLINLAMESSTQLGMTLIPAKVDSATDVPMATRAFLGKIDALWMVADKTVLNARSFRTLLEFTWNHKIPFFSFSHKLVEAGALVSLSPDYLKIGRQAAKISNKILFDGLSPKLIPIATPDSLDIALNLSTAKRIGVECDLALEIFTFAAVKQYRIRVYK